MKFQHIVASASTVLALGLASDNAQAYKLDISAVTGGTTDITLEAGTYSISWIGTVDGGAYDGWQFNNSPSGNWREAFSLTNTAAGTTQVFDVYSGTSSYYTGYSSAAAALTAAKSGPFAVAASDGNFFNGSTIFASTPVSGALTLTLASQTTLKFGVPDYLFTDNSGGVSLNITAVPEPETVALMLAGLAAVGFAVRRRTA